MEKLRDISPEERRGIQRILSGFLEGEEGILFAYLHGSFSEGRPFRDIDVAVFVAKGSTLKNSGTAIRRRLARKKGLPCPAIPLPSRA
jgi:predicted nucleotidyltransferase